MCTNDSQRLVDTLFFVHYIVGGPVMVIVGTVYCCMLLGPWALLGAAIILIYYPYQVSFTDTLVSACRGDSIKVQSLLSLHPFPEIQQCLTYLQ